MARGDLVVFEEAKAEMIEGNWASDDDFYLAICDNTTPPTAADAAPVISDYTQVGAGGTYVNNGTNLGALSVLISEAGGTVTVDSATNPNWPQDPGNDIDAWWAIAYNFTDAGKYCWFFVDLDGPVNMQAGDLTITWAGAGMFTIDA